MNRTADEKEERAKEKEERAKEKAQTKKAREKRDGHESQGPIRICPISHIILEEEKEEEKYKSRRVIPRPHPEPLAISA